MNLKRKLVLPALLLSLLLVLSACGSASASGGGGDTRIIIDGDGREVEIPANVESIVCVNVGALRYTCYMGAQNLVIGVEDYEREATMSRLYNYVNFEQFKALPVIGSNGEHYPEAIIDCDPDVIIMAAFDDNDADSLQAKTGIPVVVVPSIDSTMDERAYETFRIMGEVYGMQERADELCAYMDGIKADLSARTADIADSDRPAVYIGGVSFKGHHGFEGTEAGYGPFSLINAKNLADETGQSGAFNIDLEQVLVWDPDIIFVDFNGLGLVNADLAKNPDYYSSLTAVSQGRVYSQISFRSSASNLETALADAYYAGSVIYPEQFADIDIEQKTAEIFTTLLGSDPYGELKEAGYEFKALELGQ